MPVGAGLCVTRCIADAYLKLISRLNVTDLVDRRGGRLFSGGDDLFSWTASWEGQGFGLFPQLRMTHLMLAKRFSQEHFLRLTHDHTFSHGVLRYLLSGTEPNPIDIFDYARMFLHLLRHGKFSFLCHWYSSQGEAGARRFINEHHLRPLEAGPQGEIMDRQPQFGAASGARV